MPEKKRKTTDRLETDVRFEQPQPACRIAAVGSAAAFLIDPGGDHYQLGAGEIRIVSVGNVDEGRQWRAVRDIHGDCTRSFAVPVEDHDFACRAAKHRCEQTGRTNRS
jgi:hypothetical protein